MYFYKIQIRMRSPFSGNTINLLTVGDNFLMGSYMTPVNDNFRFRVRACQDVHVAFMVPAVEIVYELLIGTSDNTHTILKTKTDRGAVNQPTPGILDCDGWRSFWVRVFTAGRVTQFDFGRGLTVGQGKVFHHYEADNPHFQTIALASSNGHVAEFEYYQSHGRFRYNVAHIFS